MKKLILIAAVLMMSMLCSCSTFWQNDMEFSAGEVLTPEDIQSYKDAFNTTKKPSTQKKPQTNAPQTKPKPETTVPLPETGEIPTDPTTVIPETTVLPDEPTTVIPDTSPIPDEPTTALPETSEAPSETTTVAPDTSEIPNETTSSAPETSETTAPTTETDEQPDETTKPDSVTVYWTESGTKYHTHRDCGSLKNSTNVISGTLDEALEAEKEGLCKHCEKKDNPEETEE